MHGGNTAAQFAENYGTVMETALVSDRAARQAEGLERDPMWTESIAVGNESFVRQIEEQTKNRIDLEVAPTSSGAWTVRETVTCYGQFSLSKTASNP